MSQEIDNWKFEARFADLHDQSIKVSSWARIFSNFMGGETCGDLWSVQDFAHASIVLDQN
jgi:hypothetical protein